jgi:hypothetical protein
MRKAFILIMALVAIAACSQNNKEPGGGQGSSSNVVEAPAAPGAAPMPSTTRAPSAIADEVLALYSGVVIEVTNKATGEALRVDVPFGESVAVEGTPMTLDVVQFLPDFVMGEDGYSTRSLDPVNVAAQVHIHGVDPEFNGVLFMQYPDIHPYEGSEYAVVLVGVINK